LRGDSLVAADARLIDWLRSGDGGIAITGASGWIGGAMAHVALEAMAEAGAGRLRLFGSQARVVEIAGRAVTVEPLQGARPLGDGEWLVLHMAVAGADRFADPLALRAANEGMLADVLAVAATGRVRRLVHASSGAVYQAGQGPPEKRAYSDLKRDQEQVVQAWSRTTGVPVLMPRIFNVGGPYMTHPDRYALGSFIQQALAGAVIEIGARRPVVRSYVHGLELARVTFDLALDQEAVATFDTAGPDVVEMADLAQAVGRALGLPDLAVERPPMDSGAQADRYVGDGAPYATALARMALSPVALDTIIRDTAAWLGR
jgi:nucleoside-diphosphate-sugar epimerase